MPESSSDRILSFRVAHDLPFPSENAACLDKTALQRIFEEMNEPHLTDRPAHECFTYTESFARLDDIAGAEQYLAYPDTHTILYFHSQRPSVCIQASYEEVWAILAQHYPVTRLSRPLP